MAVAAQSVEIDAGVLHPSGGDTVSVVDVGVGGVGVGGVGVMHPTWLSNWGSWVVRAGNQLWGVDVVSHVGDGAGVTVLVAFYIPWGCHGRVAHGWRPTPRRRPAMPHAECLNATGEMSSKGWNAPLPRRCPPVDR